MKLFSTILKLTGGALVFFAAIGFIFGLFDYALVLKGSEMPMVDGPMAIALIVIGAIFWVIGYFLLKRAEKNDSETVQPKLDVNDLGFISSAIKRTRRRNLWIGIPCLIFGGFFAFIPFADPEADPASGTGIFMFVLAGITVAVGVFLIMKAMKLMNIEDSDVYKTIIMQPQTITGVHAQIMRNNMTKYGSQINATMFVGSRKLPVLSVSENELELLRQYLVKHNPKLLYDVSEQVVR